MKLRKLLLAGAATAVLGGCAAYPYDYGYPNQAYNQPYNNDYYAPAPGYYAGPGYYTGPGYYVAPSVGFGFTYGYYGHHHRHY